MSTHANVYVERADGTWARVYVHSDGYPEHTGRILLANYNSQERAEELVRLGDLSQIAPDCGKPEGHSFNHSANSYCVYYGRDWGEADTGPEVADALERLHVMGGGSYLYVWRREAQTWFCGKGVYPALVVRPLSDVPQG